MGFNNGIAKHGAITLVKINHKVYLNELKRGFSSGSYLLKKSSAQSAKKEEPQSKSKVDIPIDGELYEKELIEKTNKFEISPLTNAVVTPRLQDHFWNTVAPDLVTLLYNPRSPLAKIEYLEKHPDIKNKQLSEEFIQKVFNSPLEKIPTYPTGPLVTHKLCRDYGRSPKVTFSRRYRRGFVNPIDYTSVPKHILEKKRRNIMKTPYSPLPSRIPQLSEIEFECRNFDIIRNKNMSLVSLGLVGCISGARPDNLYANFSDPVLRIRKGVLIGSRAAISGEPMYNFVDKLIHCILPRWQGFKGINPHTDHQGRVTMLLPAKVVALFPDVENHFENIPKFYPLTVKFKFNTRAQHEILPLLSSFQIPVKPKFVPKLLPIKKAKKFYQLRRIAMFTRNQSLRLSAIKRLRGIRRTQRVERIMGVKKNRRRDAVSKKTKRRRRIGEKVRIRR